MGKATGDLRKEHDAILFVLRILDKMMPGDNVEKSVLLQYYNEVVYFLKVFADKCHHSKEEIYLFQELVRKGIPDKDGPIDVMLQEHTLGRKYIAKMSSFVESNDIAGFSDVASKYCDLLRKHIEKENNVLFSMADSVLTPDEQDRLFEKFEQYEENVIGPGLHEKLHLMIDKWAGAFDVK